MRKTWLYTALGAALLGAHAAAADAGVTTSHESFVLAVERALEAAK